MLMYSPRWLFLFPGLALMLGGLLLGLALLPGPLMISDRIGLDVHTLLFASAAIVVGFQAVAFALFARIYAYTQGLLPSDPMLDRLFTFLNLETGLAVGISIFAAGLAGAAYSVWYWSASGFGGLDPSRVLRTAIPSATAICLGGQIILSSFLLSILGLRRR
jgi:hypothetical protein